MKSSRTFPRLSILLLLYPWLVSYAPVDSLTREFAISLGAGKEVRISRDCNGNILSKDVLPFNNIGGSYKTTLSEHVAFKVSAGTGALTDNGSYYRPNGLSDSLSGKFVRSAFYYITPKISFNWRYLNVTLGAMVSSGFERPWNLPFTPTGSIRIGSERGIAWWIDIYNHDLMMGPGLICGGWSLALPVGKPEDDMYLRLKIGTGVGPMTGAKFDIDVPVTKQLTVSPGAIVGDENGGQSAYGTIKYRF